MIEVRAFAPETIKKAYDRRSWIYIKTVARREHRYHLLAIEQANVSPGEKVLEVATGPGVTLVELAKRAGPETTIYGTDISTGMLELAKERLLRDGFPNFVLREADCRELPFEENSFDVLYNGYMLDLMPLDELSHVIHEFKRVLKPGGRLVLLNKSKKDERRTRMEQLYESLPAWVVLYFFGLCRPVLMEQIVKQAGFENVSRLYIDDAIGSEIVVGRKQ